MCKACGIGGGLHRQDCKWYIVGLNSALMTVVEIYQETDDIHLYQAALTLIESGANKSILTDAVG